MDRSAWIVLTLIVSMLLGSGILLSAGGANSEKDERGREDFPDSEDLQFMENLGQLERSDIEFYTTGSTRYAIGERFIQVFKDEDNGRISSVRLDFQGGSPSGMIPVGPSDTTYSFFKGDDPENWVTEAHDYSSILIEDLYDDVDLKIYSERRGLKYDLIVRPGGDPSDIKISWIGAVNIELIGTSEVYLRSGTLEIVDGPLFVHQDEEPVNADYHLEGNEICFKIDGYDPSRDLVIDPLLLASTYHGGNDWDRDLKVEIDPQGRPIIAGTTDSTDFPYTTGAYSSVNRGEKDIFVSRLSQDLSSLLHSTYFGGSSYDNMDGLAVGDDGKVYICGGTNSTNIPGTSGKWISSAPQNRNGFLVAFNPLLNSIHYSTYIGGSSTDFPLDVAVDDSGRAYVTGYTLSSDFRTTAGSYQESMNGTEDAFLVKIESDGSSAVFSTLIGGEDWSDRSYAVVVDENGYPTIAGQTTNNDFPTTPGVYLDSFGYYMGFLTRFEPNGSALNFSTFFANGTWIYEMALGPQNDYYLTGMTRTISGDFPVTNDAYDKDLAGEEDAFYSRLSSDGTNLVYSTFLGADEEDDENPNLDYIEFGLDIDVDREGRVYVCGPTDAPFFPTTIGAYDTTRNGQDSFLTIFSASGDSLLYSTFLGGSDEDKATGLVLNGSNGLYMVGETYSNYPSHDFPVKDGYDESFNSGYDGYATWFKLDSYTPSPPLELVYFSGDSFVNLSWKLPQNDGGEQIEGYSISRGRTLGSMSPLSTAGPTHRNYNDTTASNGILYYYKVRAFNKVGNGTGSTILAMASTIPGPPTSIMAKPGPKSVELIWSIPSDLGGLPGITYNIYAGSSPSTLNIAERGWINNSFIVTGLRNGFRYYFAVSATNARGDGPFSEIVSAIPLDVPSIPLNLTYELDPFQVHLDWDRPTDNGGSNNVTYRVLSGPNMTALEEISGNLVNTTYTHLTAYVGKDTIYTVVAINEMGSSLMADHLTIVPLGELTEPRNLSAAEFGDHIDLSWKPPSTVGGARNITYEVFMGPDPENLTVHFEGIDSTFTRINMVTTGLVYSFGVKASNSHWSGPMSEIVSIISYEKPSMPRNLTVTPGDGKAVLKWEKPLYFGGVVNITYEIHLGTDPDEIEFHSEVTTNGTTLTRLENGITYYVSVNAVNHKGNSSLTPPVSFRSMGFPTAPRNVEYTEGDGILNITWDPPLSKGGAVAVTYEIRVGPSETELPNVIENITDNWFMLEDLENGRFYYFQVFAVTEVGVSPGSEIIFGVPMTYPTVPRDVNLSYSKGIVTVTWKSPQSNGGGEIWYYRIFRGDSKDTMELIDTVGGSVDSYEDSSVEEGRMYYYSIQAESSYGMGPRSDPKGIETKEAISSSLGIEDILKDYGLIILLCMIIILVLAGILMLIRRKGRRTRMVLEE
ncbi:MAG: fibronectin type III domain-containing protein [Thermoplasmatota archaeon]